MKKPTVIDKRVIRLEEITKPGSIPFLGGRPKRTSIITGDEIINLKILLNTAVSVSDFLEKIA
jgi:hypothetical protein